MSVPILATKLYIPPSRPAVVPRPHLLKRLDEGLSARRKLTLISAPAGFGKSTLVSEWIHTVGAHHVAPRRAAWLSLDKEDSDPVRFLAYLVAALQSVVPELGEGVLRMLQAPQPPPIEALLTALLNEIATLPERMILVLDDYHVIEAPAVDVSTSVTGALTFLLEHLPPQLHLVIATREDPYLPLARLRARGQLVEVRADDLRFTPTEATEFLNRLMGLELTMEEIAALETRTEGWIAGLQLAALALQGQPDAAGFIHAFTGSHRFVMDYLLEEVLHQQPPDIQTFLLRTSVLDRLCGPLCDAVTRDPSTSGQEILEYLERANLFVVPLDNERRWYRYHHLFADLLRQRLQQTGEEADVYHIRASRWYEAQGLALEAFRHAAAADDIERAERLIESEGMPLHFRDALVAILDWLASLPTKVLDARPLLWVRYATLSLVAGQTTGVEEHLQAAEAALANSTAPEDAETRNLTGEIAAARATLALTQYRPESMIAQSLRALEHLSPDNLTFRATANWVLGVAYYFQGERAAAGRAIAEAISLSQASGDTFTTIVAMIGLGQVQEAENQLHRAAETYRRGLELAGEHPQPNACEAHLGLARIHYQWNDLEAAEEHGQQGLRLARQYDRVIDRFVTCEVFLARLQLARGDAAGAMARLDEAAQVARRRNFEERTPEVAAPRVLLLLRQEDLAAAAQLAEVHELPLSRARVHLAEGDPVAALEVLEPWRRQAEAKGWPDEVLQAQVLEAVALHASGETEAAEEALGDALTLAEPGGFVRIFIDEGAPMLELLTRMHASDEVPSPHVKRYVERLLAAFDAPQSGPVAPAPESGRSQPLVEPLSPRELEVLRLVAEGLSNREIAERLFIALSTVKTHNRNIYEKLQVHRRTEAVARARELRLL